MKEGYFDRMVRIVTTDSGIVIIVAVQKFYYLYTGD